MAIGWFVVPYKRRVGESRPIRYCAMDDHTAVIRADGGTWAEVEVLGDRAIVKVRASAGTLSSLAVESGFVRLPLGRLDDALSGLSVAQRNNLRDLVLDLGYSLAELRAALGDDLGQRTLGEVVRFMASRRRKPRYDPQTDSIILDGPAQGCRPVEEVDRGVQ